MKKLQLMGGCQFEEEEDIFIISKYLPTNYLVMTKAKIVTLQWINLANTALTKESKLISPVMEQTNIICAF